MSERSDGTNEYLRGLNAAQLAAATYGAEAPLLIIAGAGSGKTNTLAHRVAHLLLQGVDPRRILLLTFTRRAAFEMTRRAERIAGTALGGSSGKPPRAIASMHWSGTFHAIANRLLRIYADAIGLDPAFTVLDRSDSADLMNLIRNDLGIAKKAKRFPKKGTCLAIYSRCVNAQAPLETGLKEAFPWCEEWGEELRALFRAYVDAKQKQHVLDYDDLLLYWFYVMEEAALAERVRERFDHILVDEYQDTNSLQATILLRLKPQGQGLTAVGDDAQAIFSFRAATVRNILDFPQQFAVAVKVITLEENYRSTQPILNAANAVISGAQRRYAKQLFSQKHSHQKPYLATVEDETTQVDYVVERILANHEAGMELRRQAVLFRTAHHSDALEVELSRRNIPYVKYGGLKFLEAAHVKDVLCVLRWAENPGDMVAAFRVLQLIPGIGPERARRLIEHIQTSGVGLKALPTCQVPAAAREIWPATCELFARLSNPATDWRGQLHLVREWYEPRLAELYDNAPVRHSDLEELDQISSAYPTRERFLSELTLDPPEASGDLAGTPLLEEDYLILSTIHSSKGQEWDAVYILNCADGCIPSDMATGDPEQLEEERRLLYVAMTRAKRDLHLIHPLRFFVREQRRYGDRYVYAPLSRFLQSDALVHFERVSRGRSVAELEHPAPVRTKVDITAKLRGMW